MSNNEYEQQQFWKDKPKLTRIVKGYYIGQQLMDDLLIWGECAYKISDQGIERIKPNKWITNGK